jgi:hypothetical protein
MARSDPQGQMELTAEPLTHDLVCSWPPACRNTSDLLSTKYACALRIKLEAQKLKVGPIQPGPRETEDAGLPSVWFEYDDGKHFLRQAIAFSTDRAISLVLVAPTGEARATHTRAFEQALRTLHPLSAEEAARAEGNLDAGAPPPGDRAVTDGGSRVDGGPPVDGGLAAASPIADAGPNDAGVNGLFEPAPTPRFDPTTPCK